MLRYLISTTSRYRSEIFSRYPTPGFSIASHLTTQYKFSKNLTEILINRNRGNWINYNLEKLLRREILLKKQFVWITYLIYVWKHIFDICRKKKFSAFQLNCFSNQQKSSPNIYYTEPKILPKLYLIICWKLLILFIC